MALGAYAVIRFADILSDQRVNIGVVVWHPIDGFRHRFSAALLDRVHAIDPRLSVPPLRGQLEVIANELKEPSAGRDTLERLAVWFKEGLEVAPPYPARIQSADETLEHLYQTLVSPVPEIRRASSQVQFESKIKHVIRDLAALHKLKWEEVGPKKFGSVSVNVGLRTIKDHRKSLWRALSLQAVDQTERQIALAKATAMDISVIRGSDQYKDHAQNVTVLPPKPGATDGLKEAIAWLHREADSVFTVDDVQALPRVLEKAVLRHNGAR